MIQFYLESCVAEKARITIHLHLIVGYLHDLNLLYYLVLVCFILLFFMNPIIIYLIGSSAL